MILCLYNVNTLNICMKEFYSEKIFFDEMTAVRTMTIFPLLGFCICIDGAFMGRSTPTTALDGTFFVCTDSTEIFLSKLRSSCSNYNLPSFFTDSYCAGGYLISIAY